MSGSASARAIVVLLIASCASMSQEATLSGTVLDAWNQPLAGVSVSLAIDGSTTTSDAQGRWTLVTGTARDAVTREARPGTQPSSALELDGSRIRMRFDGHRVDGRSAASPRAAASPSGTIGARAMEPRRDTLQFSLGGKVRLRDTLSIQDISGISRRVDTTVNAAIIHGYFVDIRDGRQYRTVKIGSQTWMAENLDYAGGATPIGLCNGAADSCQRYGRLYSWKETMQVGRHYDTTLLNPAEKYRGVCPTGWHVPSLSDWNTLMTTVDPDNSYDGIRLKSPYFWSNSKLGKDIHGFRALPGGLHNGGAFSDPGPFGYWWTTTESFRTYANHVIMYSENDNVHTGTENKLASYSVRCMLD